MSSTDISSSKSTDICKCCLHLPAPPEDDIAKLSLIKQLNLYLELEALLMNSSKNDQLNNYDDVDDDINPTEESDSSYLDYDEQLQNNNSYFKKDHCDEYDEDDEENLSCTETDELSEGNIFLVRPLLPSFLYDFSNSNKPLIGRDWLFKEIEKVMTNLF